MREKVSFWVVFVGMLLGTFFSVGYSILNFQTQHPFRCAAWLILAAWNVTGVVVAILEDVDA